MGTKEQDKIIEECVFLHKRILIGSKTLLDTVLPKDDWSLKAARKLFGCACCAPDDEEEEEEEEEDENTEKEKKKNILPFDISSNNNNNEIITNNDKKNENITVFSNNKKQRPKYVDGKMGFAFDPTMFSKKMIV